MTSPFHTAALQYIEAGFPVFPCHPGTKVPATPNGFHGASLNRAQVDAWWAEDPAYNVAFSPGSQEISTWIVLICGAAIGLGTLSGGWRIVKTMGQKITKLKPVGGFCAETGGAITLFLATAMGIPVSTTHTITGAIVGVGSTSGRRNVRWGVAGSIVWAWIFTIPASALIAAAAWWLGTLVL